MIKRLILTICLLSTCLFALPQPAYAALSNEGVNCGTAGDSAICNDNTGGSNPISGSKGVLLKATNIIAFVAGAAAIIIIIVSALKFVTAGSDTSKGGRVDTDVEDARRSLGAALVGLVIVVLARSLIAFFVKKL